MVNTENFDFNLELYKQRQAEQQSRLEDQLRGDVAQAVTTTKGVEQYRGIKTPSASEEVGERGMRFSGKIMAQKAFEDSIKTQKEVIDQMSQKMNFANTADQKLFQDIMNERINKARRMYMSFTRQQQKQAAGRMAKEQKTGNFWKAIGGIGGAIGGMLIAGPLGTGFAGTAMGGMVGSKVGEGVAGIAAGGAGEAQLPGPTGMTEYNPSFETEDEYY